jgi:hypothetical protein
MIEYGAWRCQPGCGSIGIRSPHARRTIQGVRTKSDLAALLDLLAVDQAVILRLDPAIEHHVAESRLRPSRDEHLRHATAAVEDQSAASNHDSKARGLPVRTRSELTIRAR